MKLFIQSFALTCFLMTSISLSAQEEAALIQTSDFEEAKTLAAENDADILMLFTGSDWCKPCIKFKKTILQDATFVKNQGTSLVVLYLDFPMRKKNKLSKEQTVHNEKMASKFNKSGVFPRIVILDETGKVKGKPAYRNQSAADFSKELKTLK